VGEMTEKRVFKNGKKFKFENYKFGDLQKHFKIVLRLFMKIFEI